MKTIIIILFISISLKIYSENIYYVKDTTIYKYDLKTSKNTKVWKIDKSMYEWDLEISKNEKYIIYTKVFDGGNRSIGYYSFDSSHSNLIESESNQNYNGMMSINNKNIIFNSMNYTDHNWNISIYNIQSKELKKYIADINKTGIVCVNSWINDSVFSFYTFNRCYIYNINTNNIIDTFFVPDTNITCGIPGGKYIFTEDHNRYFVLASDVNSMIDGFDGPSDNLFLINNNNIYKVFSNKTNVSSCYDIKDFVYIKLSDYSNKKPKELVIKMNKINLFKDTINVHGSLIGVCP